MSLTWGGGGDLNFPKQGRWQRNIWFIIPYHFMDIIMKKSRVGAFEGGKKCGSAGLEKQVAPA